MGQQKQQIEVTSGNNIIYPVQNNIVIYPIWNNTAIYPLWNNTTQYDRYYHKHVLQ